MKGKGSHVQRSLAGGYPGFVPASLPGAWDLLTESGLEDGRLHPGLAGSSLAVEKLNWVTGLPTSVPQQAFEGFGLLFELLGAEFGQLAEVVQLPTDAGQLGKMRNSQKVPARLVANE